MFKFGPVPKQSNNPLNDRIRCPEEGSVQGWTSASHAHQCRQVEKKKIVNVDALDTYLAKNLKFFFFRQSPQDDTVTRRVTQVTVCAKLKPRKLRLPASKNGASHTQRRIPQHPSTAAPRSLDRVCFRHFPKRKRTRSWSLAHSISLIDGRWFLPKVHAYWSKRRISWPCSSAIWFLACAGHDVILTKNHPQHQLKDR